jgi:hypothetical protein
VTDRQPHPHTRRNRDHRRDSALTTAAANAAGIEPGIRTRALPTSTSIAARGKARRRSPQRSRPARSAPGRTRPHRAVPAASDRSGPRKYRRDAPPQKPPPPAQNSPRRSPASDPRSTGADARGR